MELVVGDKRTEIDVGKMTVEIDNVFHNEISIKTGVIIGHDEIVRFIAGFIHDMNKLELQRQHEMKMEDERLKMDDDEMMRKIEKCKVVGDLNSIGNKIKYIFLGYILYNGDGDNK